MIVCFFCRNSIVRDEFAVFQTFKNSEVITTHKLLINCQPNTIVRLCWTKTLRGCVAPWMIVETNTGDVAQGSEDDEGSSSNQLSPKRTKTTRTAKREGCRRLLIHRQTSSSPPCNNVLMQTILGSVPRIKN